MNTADANLPARALATSAEQPWPVRVLSDKIAAYVARMSSVWVEGQIVQVNRRPGAAMVFFTLRDTEAEVSLPVKIWARDLGATSIEEGARVVVNAKPDFWRRNGSLSLHARHLQQVGIGQLLARIEELKKVLAAEGLFDVDRKTVLPFLPTCIGLICGRESKAEHDVVVNARSRWPGVRFEIREVAVQGTGTVPQVSQALAELDAADGVEVIVIARGGGSVEDLLPFSNERLLRAAAACRTPLVSAIGHETDTPLLDLVADYRASTPTAAAKRIVPDVSEERHGLRSARERIRTAMTARLQAEAEALATLRSRPVLARPTTIVEAREEELDRLRTQLRHRTTLHLERAGQELIAARGHLRALSPQATLARGYAVLRTSEGRVVASDEDTAVGEVLEARLAGSRLRLEVLEQPG